MDGGADVGMCQCLKRYLMSVAGMIYLAEKKNERRDEVMCV